MRGILLHVHLSTSGWADFNGFLDFSGNSAFSVKDGEQLALQPMKWEDLINQPCPRPQIPKPRIL